MGSNPTGVLITDDSFCQEEKEKLQELRSFKNAIQMKNVRLSWVFQRECMTRQTFFDGTLVSAAPLNNAGTNDPLSLTSIVHIGGRKALRRRAKRCDED